MAHSIRWFIASVVLALIFSVSQAVAAFDFTVVGGVKNVHLPDNTYSTYLDVEVNAVDSTGPEDFSTVEFSGPNGIIATYALATDTTDPATLDVQIDGYDNGGGAYLWLIVPGQPDLGTYTITVTSSAAHGNMQRTATDEQTVIREIPLPDESSFSPQPSVILSAKSPEFSWNLVPYSEPLYYRFEIYDAAQENKVFGTSRMHNMSSFIPPPGTLQPGVSYNWRVRITDSDNWIAVENRSHSDWQPFSMGAALGPKPALDLDGWGIVNYKTASNNGIDNWVKVIDHGGVSSECHTVSVQPPASSPLADPINLTYSHNDSNSIAFFYGWIDIGSDDPANYAGDWTYTVNDCVGNSASLTDTLTVTPLPLPDESTFQPTDGAILTNTTPTFSWLLSSGANGDKVNHYRVRIYDAAGNNTVFRGYTGDMTYTVPPGVLEPSTTYSYRIDARDSHFSFETDNNSTAPDDPANYFNFTTGLESPEPYIDLDNSGVQTWNRETFGPSYSFWIKVFDVQGVPDNIASVKVILPDTTELPLRPDYFDSDFSGYYHADYFASIVSGTFTFRVEDNEGNIYEKQEVFENNPVGFPAESSMLPARGTLLGTTAVDFDWEDVEGAAFYRVEIYDENFNRIHSLATTTSNLSLPEGFLEEGKFYSYRITTRREFFDENVDNGSSSPHYSENRPYFITTAPPGDSAPTIDIGNWGAVLWHEPRPDDPSTSNYWMTFFAQVQDDDGAPHSIQKVEVTFPNGDTRTLGYDGGGGSVADYWYTEDLSDPTLMPEGIYTFTATDVNGNTSLTLTDDFVRDVIAIPENLMPPGDSVVGGLGTPIEISWDPVPNAAIYRVEFYDESGDRFYRPYTTETSYRVPAGILDPNATYSYRIRAHLVDPNTTEMDNISMSAWWNSSRPHFQTASILDSDGDNISDDIEMSHCCLDPDNSDTDDDGIPDGVEDANQNGICDAGESNPVPQCGDVTDDCQTDLKDLIQVLKIIADTGATGRAAGDCDGDNKIGMPEALAILSPDQGTSSPYYEIYGAMAGDYNLTTVSHTLIGTSADGNEFDVSSYDRFIVYVPASSEQIYFDAFGLDFGWVESDGGDENTHYTTNIRPTGGTWAESDHWIEGPPDGDTIENYPVGSDAYYSFSTMGAQTLKVYVVGEFPTNVPLLNSIPSASITLDGNNSDWTNISPVINDQQGDSTCSDTTRDIKSLSLAKDESNIYWKVETWTGTYPASGFIVTFQSSDGSSEVQNNVHVDGSVDFSERFGNNDYYYLFGGDSSYVSTGEISEGRFPLSMFTGHVIEKSEAIYVDWAVSGTGCDYTVSFP